MRPVGIAWSGCGNVDPTCVNEGDFLPISPPSPSMLYSGLLFQWRGLLKVSTV